MTSRRVAFYTLGCKVNRYDTEALRGLFRRRGYRVVDFEEEADIYVINTCTVTGRGEARSRQVIRRARRRNPDALVVVAGCYPQARPGEVERIPGVDLVVGTGDRSRLVDLVQGLEGSDRRDGRPLVAVSDIMQAQQFEELPIEEFRGRTRATVKIQDGCDLFCSYCIIPYARGPARSRRPEEVLSEVERLARAGFKEVVLTGIHLGAYGNSPARDRGQYGRLDLAGILELIHPVAGLERIRLSSVEPTDVTPRLVEAVASLPKVCRHLHIPLQSGHDRVLRRMNRHYTTARYRELVSEARKGVPDLAVSTDVMVGFPGETEEEFEASYRFIEEMAFSRLHVFPYSPRAGTPAAGFPDQVPEKVKEERSRRLLALGVELSCRFSSRYLGKTVEVLVEQAEDRMPDLLEGLTDNYIRVTFRGPAELRNSLVKVRLTSISPGGVKGKLEEKPKGINRFLEE